MLLLSMIAVLMLDAHELNLVFGWMRVTMTSHATSWPQSVENLQSSSEYRRVLHGFAFVTAIAKPTNPERTVDVDVSIHIYGTW